MPRATSLPEFYDVTARGPALQAVLLAADMLLPATVGSSTIVTSSSPVYADGYNFVSFAGIKSNAGSISVQAFVDAAGLIPQGSAVTASVTGGTAAVANLSAAALGGCFQSLRFAVSNSSAGGPESLSSLLALLSATNN